MKDAHKKAIEYAKEAGAIISFDPNIRLALWENASDLKAAILEFMPKANILKVSDEEIEFITGKKTVEEAGDAFIGSFLYQLSADGIDLNSLADVSKEKMEAYLEFSNRYCAKSVLKAGAIASYPTRDEM